MNRWWVGQTGESFWLEVTRRNDLGADLNAPIYNDGGHEDPRYTLLRELKRGDVVYHYYAVRQAIVSRSVVAAPAIEDTVVWGARGPSARAKGTKPYPRPGLRVALTDYEKLVEPVSLTVVRAQKIALLRLREALKNRHGDPLYQPFELGDKRPPRPVPGYIFKLPADYLDVLGLTPSADDEQDGPRDSEVEWGDMEVVEYTPRAKKKRRAKGKGQGEGSKPPRRSRESKKVGDAGEKHVKQFEINRLGKGGWTADDPDVKWLADLGEHPGYDILSYNLDGSERWIEVKSSKGSRISSVELTDNERRKAMEAPKGRYWLYLVQRVFGKPTVEMIQDPVGRLFEGKSNPTPATWTLEV